MILNIFLIVVFLATALALFRDGLWSALIMLLNILLATTVASAWYETVARLLDAQAPSYTYLFDFFSMWGLFALVLLAMREVTDRLSRTKVKFVKQVEMVGAPLVAILAGWIMICFAAAALHTAAVPRSLVQPTPGARMFFGLSPDRKWLAWTKWSTEKGPFARAGHVFDPDSDFILRYADRRHKLEQEEGLRTNTGPAKK